MSKNYGAGSRDMLIAGRLLLKNRSANGFKTKSDYSDRWRLFCMYAEENGVRKMEAVTPEFVIGYGQHLQRQLEAGVYSSASAPKNYLSVVNCVMRLATGGQWATVRPGKDCGIERRKYISKESKAMPETKHQEVRQATDERLASLMDLQRVLGLRFKESCLFDAKHALKQADKFGFITIEAGTKGGRPRRLTCDDAMRAVIEVAAGIQKGASMIPKGMTYVKFREECYRQGKVLGISFHPERHAFAQQRYRELVNAPCPLEAGWEHKGRLEKLADYLSVSVDEARDIDRKARLKISTELGHSRLEISNAYLG
ncbi:MAG: integrase domain-containing protein [Methylobacter sp.]|nr:integrase domain-containing protein [Methylobacter sp.]MDP3362373.1 integrase domain-containing protein [Methylobacter sp.]